MTPVQALIQEMLNAVQQFSESAQRLGVTGRAQLSVAVPRSTLPVHPAAEKNTGGNETKTPLKIKHSPEWSENVTELVADNTPEKDVETVKSYDLGNVLLAYQEYLVRRERVQNDNLWIEEFQKQLDRVSDGAEHFTLNGREVITYKRNGNLNVKRLESEHPNLVTHYTRLVTKLQFDKEAFKQEEPELFAAYRAKVFHVSPKATR